MPDDSVGPEPTLTPEEEARGESLAPGTELREYRVIRELGRGGMGQVYEVEHKVLRRTYALKVLPQAFSRRPGFIERFKQEAAVMANLDHSGILPVDEFAETNDRYWLRMPLVRGIDLTTIGFEGQATTLAELAKKCGGRVDQNLLADLLVQVLDALHYAHGKGAVHRDLKPANVLLDERGGRVMARVSDFGLVRIVGEDWLCSQARKSATTNQSIGGLMTEGGDDAGESTRSLLGTYEYMSPEQKLGEQADARSDLYAVGLMAFRLLTGRQVLDYDRPSEIDAALAPEWDQFIRRAVRSDKEQRFQSADEMAKELKGIQSVLARKVPTPQPTAKETARAPKTLPETPAKEVKQPPTVEPKSAPAHKRPSPPPVATSGLDARLLESGGAVGKRKKWWPKVAVVVGVIVAVTLIHAALSPRRQVSTPRPQTIIGKPPEPAKPQYVLYTHWPFDRAEAKRRQNETAEALGVPTEKTIDLGNGVKLELVLIPAGEFTMGSPANEAQRDDDEGPQHKVRITKPFYMGKYELTQEQWERVVGNNPSNFKGTRNPVESVSWNDCQDFIKKLNGLRKDKGTFSLPTEAEWEYACRAGTATKYGFGDNDRELGDYAWYNSNSGSKTHPVGQKKSNAFGLYDMHGNVWEWCADWYDKDYYDKSPKDDPAGPATGSYRVVRGGSWYSVPYYLRSATRRYSTPDPRSRVIGVRVVLSASGP